ncbi:hypothetical protein CEXT_651901 [Caerostris extrusa]|uniref:Uncharacterized protein n=1 Tax=Caerostris extrusa TaxID=172846 RepID=A0AAV4YDY1_CAEEX|nr:hypothetical protein CEXT_651901 [Caerostris extrusa]
MCWDRSSRVAHLRVRFKSAIVMDNIIKVESALIWDHRSIIGSLKAWWGSVVIRVQKMKSVLWLRDPGWYTAGGNGDCSLAWGIRVALSVL